MTMKNFKQIREKTLGHSVIDEKNHMSFVMKDMKTAEFVKKELSGIVKAEFDTSKKGPNYVLNVMPSSPQDEKIVKSFMDDAKIEMIKDEFVRGLMRSSSSGEPVELSNFNEELLTITPDQSKKVVEVHDSLNKDNQEVFMEMLVHSKDTFDQVMNFCETYSTEGKR